MDASSSNQSGKAAEGMARLFLQSHGLQILADNWRYKQLEIDLIAVEGDVLVFVEVKSRSKDTFVDTKQLLSLEKQERLTRAAEAYLQINPHQGEVRFDLIAFVANRIQYIKDAFWNY